MGIQKRPTGVTIVAVLSLLAGLGAGLEIFSLVIFYLTNPTARSIYMSNGLAVAATLILDIVLAPLFIRAGLGLWRLKRPGIQLAQLAWTIKLVSPIVLVILAVLSTPMRGFNCTIDIISIGVLIYLNGLSKRLEYKEKTVDTLPDMDDVEDIFSAPVDKLDGL